MKYLYFTISILALIIGCNKKKRTEGQTKYFIYNV